MYESLVGWYVLYTKPRHEKLVEAGLLQKGIEAFTPKVSLRKRWSDRIKVVEEPLFKSYCFAQFSLFDKTCVLSQRGVVDLVHFRQHYIPVQNTVIDSLRTLTAHQMAFNPYPYLKVGDKVVVRRGPLKDVEGFLVEKRNKNAMLVISVDAITSSVQCIVDSDWVDAA
ncbi:MAG: UpxY family transcription antiterminator [Candidatus Omnitrophica bacterium]|nr:UpxY family transcription antiterminator [Candidatus Omnitrophota bacterium]